ncbi:unnamed protein product, partial [marine sediment metagenome]
TALSRRVIFLAKAKRSAMAWSETSSTEDRVRLFRLIEKLAFESRDIVSNIHGAGSPETHKMAILRNADIESKKKLAKNLAGIKEE